MNAIRVRRVAYSLLILGCLSFVGCGSSEEAACSSPKLLLSADEFLPGDKVTVTWEGLVECEGDPLGSVEDQVIPLSIAQWEGTPGPNDPFQPEVVVDKWADISLKVGEGESPTVDAILPDDLESGQYYVFASDPALAFVESEPFTIVAG